MKITDVFFDLDHTLWDFERNSALAFETILDKHKVNVSLSEFLEHYVPMNLKYWERYRNDEISQYQLRYGRLNDTFRLLDYSVTNELIDTLSDDYINYLPLNNHLFEGTIDVLNYLSEKYRLHIITNGFEQIQTAKLTNSNIIHYFKTVTNSELAGVKKPNPVIFEYALKTAGAEKQSSIMIGDCIDADVRGAINFGMDAILFGPICDFPGIKHVSQLNDLKKYL